MIINNIEKFTTFFGVNERYFTTFTKFGIESGTPSLLDKKAIATLKEEKLKAKSLLKKANELKVKQIQEEVHKRLTLKKQKNGYK